MAQDKVTQILLDRMLKVIEQENVLPWKQPWRYRYAFNYFNEYVYKGINRWILPAGEYMTAAQLNKYNSTRGTDYKFIKGIEWLPVLFLKEVDKVADLDEITEDGIEKIRNGRGRVIRVGNGKYFVSQETNKIMQRYLCRRYYSVADIRWFEDSNGNKLPSKIESGEIVFYYEKPDEVSNNYIEREGISVRNIDNGSHYEYSSDTICIPKLENFYTSEGYYATLFHEMAHSTGAKSRLNRPTTAENRGSDRTKKERSKEELIAEMCSCLLCVETGIFSLEGEKTEELERSESYIKSWADYLRNTKDDVIFTASEAEKASKYILGEKVGETEECLDRIESI